MRVLVPLGLFLAATGLSPVAEAQAILFGIDPDQSQWTWHGNTSVGWIDYYIPSSFQLSGSLLQTVEGGGNPIGGGQVLSAFAVVPVVLRGEVPASSSNFPPVLTVEIFDLKFDVATLPFTVDAAGNFTTDVTVSISHGTLRLDPFPYPESEIDLSMEPAVVTTVSGTLTESGGTIELDLPLSLHVPFDDPAHSWIDGDLYFDGVLHANVTCPPPANFCPPTPNSAGPGAVMNSTGSTSLAANDLALIATGVPPNVFGVFFYGSRAIQVPFGEGYRCVGGGVHRLPVIHSGAAGVFTQAFDFTNLPDGDVFTSGDVVMVQCWFRDPQGGPTGFNLSTARQFLICP